MHHIEQHMHGEFGRGSDTYWAHTNVQYQYSPKNYKHRYICSLSLSLSLSHTHTYTHTHTHTNAHPHTHTIAKNTLKLQCERVINRKGIYVAQWERTMC